VVWLGRSGEGASLLPHLGQRPLAGQGNLCRGRPNANVLAVQMEGGVAEDKNSDQCILSAQAMALKYVLLELFTSLKLMGDGSMRGILANL